VKSSHFARLRWPNKGKARPGIIQTFSGPTRDLLVRVLASPDQTVDCLEDMLFSIASVRFVSLPVPDEIFEWIQWSDTWHRGFVDSLSHCQRTSLRRMRTARSACAGSHTWHGTAVCCWAHSRWRLQSQKAVEHNRPSFTYHVDDIKKSYFEHPTS
jgi:hypothetical protein